MNVDYPALLLAAITLLATRYVYLDHVSYAILCLSLMVALPLAYIRWRKRAPGAYLIQAGMWRNGLIISAAMILAALPIMHYGSTLQQFQKYYPTWGPASENLHNFIMFELYVLAIMVSTEVFYRGFLMNVLREHTRHGNAIHAIIYMLAHIGKPPLEVAYSLPVGWIFGEVDIKCKSILPSLTMHYISSVIFDMMILYQLGVRVV
ncbi:MAG: CPBP family intramembrane glutamic endopeptidase [Candidatus Altiarchaeota archaeon]